MPAATPVSRPSASPRVPSDPVAQASHASVGAAMPAMHELGARSRVSAALWLALAAEAGLALAVLWALSHQPSKPAPVLPTEQIQLVTPRKPVRMRKVTFRRPEPAPLRSTYRPRPIQLPPPPVAPPPAVALPPSPLVAVAPVPPPPQAAAAPTADPLAKAGYLAQVRAAIQSAVQFPAAARLLHLGGRVRIRFTLINGVVSNLRIVVPGRIKSFDANALLAVHQAAIPLPPQALRQEPFTLVLWVKFHLHRAL